MEKHLLFGMGASFFMLDAIMDYYFYEKFKNLLLLVTLRTMIVKK